jgi:hypothetical protein
LEAQPGVCDLRMPQIAERSCEHWSDSDSVVLSQSNRWPAGPPWRVALCLAQQKPISILRLKFQILNLKFEMLNRIVIPGRGTN